MTTTQILFCVGSVVPVGLIAHGFYTGRVRQRSIPRRMVERETEPGRFYLHIAFYALGGVLLLGRGVGAF